MKAALLFFAIAVLFLILLYSGVDVWFTESTIDIHVHDTYFVIARWHAILAIILFLGTFSSVGGSIETKFRNKFFLVASVLFIAIDLCIVWGVYSSFN